MTIFEEILDFLIMIIMLIPVKNLPDDYADQHPQISQHQVEQPSVEGLMMKWLSAFVPIVFH